jgi:4-amino-4-deoxy-L-arabinose transferase-like glycosyltransferase
VGLGNPKLAFENEHWVYGCDTCGGRVGSLHEFDGHNNLWRRSREAQVEQPPLKTNALLIRLSSFAILLLVFGITIYRAKVQSIAHDEALTYEWFLDGGIYKLLAFNSTNHVLFTIIAKFFVKVFGASELSLRAPSLIGAAIYLTIVYFLCRRLFGDNISFVISVAMLCLNPLVMDFLAAARGYSLGLAFFVAAIYAMARMAERGIFNPEDAEWRWGCAISSVLLALSVAANLSNLFPVASLGLSFSGMALGWFKKLDNRTFRAFGRHFVVPGVFVGLFILWPFLIQARPAQFKMGLQHPSPAGDAVIDLFNASFLYRWTGDIYSTSLGATPPMPGSWQYRVSDWGTHVFPPLLFLLVLFGLILVYRSPTESRSRQTAHCRLLGVATIACVALTVLLRVLLNVNYPVSRTGLYFVPLFTLSGLLMAREFSLRFPRYRLKWVGLIVAAAVVFDYGLSLNTQYFRYNAYDAISRQLFLIISNDARSRGLTGVRVGGTWWYEPEINFYRISRHADWMLPYDVKDRSYWWESPNSLEPADYDYFVFTPASDPGLAGPRVRTIFQDKSTGITVNAMYK